MIMAHRLAGEVGVEVQVFSARGLIAQVRAVRPCEVDDEVLAVCEHVTAYGRVHVLRRNRNDGVGRHGWIHCPSSTYREAEVRNVGFSLLILVASAQALKRSLRTLTG